MLEKLDSEHEHNTTESSFSTA